MPCHKTPLHKTPASSNYDQNPTKPALVDEMSLFLPHDVKLSECEATILCSAGPSSEIIPISTLPVDTLVKIFQLLVDTVNGLDSARSAEIPKYPILFSHVCTQWRQIVFQSPSLWSSLRLNRQIIGDRQLLGYTRFHTIQSGQALVDLSIAEDFYTGLADETPSLIEFIEPFAYRIHSLGLRLSMSSGPSEDRSGHLPHLLAQCLNMSGKLKRLSIVAPIFSIRLTGDLHWFMEGTPNSHRNNSLSLSLSHEHLEDILLGVSDLWLQGLYFDWDSKAYWGLTALRLDYNRTCSITDSQLVDVLTSSPQLRRLYVRVRIIGTTAPKSPVLLPYLEALVDTEEVSLLELVQPGSNELAVSIISVNKYVLPSGPPTVPSSPVYGTRFKSFLSRANISKFYSDEFLRNPSDICYLVSIAPQIRVLGLSWAFHSPLTGTIPDTEIPRPLDELLLFGDCRVDYLGMGDIIRKFEVKRLRLSEINIKDFKNNIVGDKASIVELLSDLNNVHVEVISDIDSLMNQFVGQVIRD